MSWDHPGRKGLADTLSIVCTKYGRRSLYCTDPLGSHHWHQLLPYEQIPQRLCARRGVCKSPPHTGTPALDTVVLTATTPPDPSSVCPIEKPESWPTYTNVANSLKRLRDAANHGDFVYIHYSGYGTQTPSDSISGHRSPGELALVLFEDTKLGQSYL